MGNHVDGRFDRRSSVNWRWKNDPHLIDDHLPILISDQADWSLIGGGKTGPYNHFPWFSWSGKFLVNSITFHVQGTPWQRVFPGFLWIQRPYKYIVTFIHNIHIFILNKVWQPHRTHHPSTLRRWKLGHGGHYPGQCTAQNLNWKWTNFFSVGDKFRSAPSGGNFGSKRYQL